MWNISSTLVLGQVLLHTSVFPYQCHLTHPCPLLHHSRITDVTQSPHACCIVLEACNCILHSATSCVLPESLHILAEVQHVTAVHISGIRAPNVQQSVAGMSPASNVSARYGNEVRKETALTLCRSTKCRFLCARFRV